MKGTVLKVGGYPDTIHEGLVEKHLISGCPCDNTSAITVLSIVHAKYSKDMLFWFQQLLCSTTTYSPSTPHIQPPSLF